MGRQGWVDKRAGRGYSAEAWLLAEPGSLEIFRSFPVKCNGPGIDALVNLPAEELEIHIAARQNQIPAHAESTLCLVFIV